MVDWIKFIVVLNAKEMKKNTDKGLKKGMTKNCNKCKKDLDIESNFYKEKRNKDGRRTICKICDGTIKVQPTHKICNMCNIEKEYSEFSLRNKSCKLCFGEVLKGNKRITNKKLELRTDHIIPELKECSDCKEIKNINDFPIRGSSKDNHRNHCILCYSNKNKIYKKVYRQKNKNSIRKKDLEYRKNRKSIDPVYRSKMIARDVIRKSLTKKGYSKKSRTYEILGCSYEDFKNHIESLFYENMNWENRTYWHIDHITPISFAQTEEESLIINHFSNLRPLWKSDNEEKNNKIVIENETYHKIINLRKSYHKEVV